MTNPCEYFSKELRLKDTEVASENEVEYVFNDARDSYTREILADYGVVYAEFNEFGSFDGSAMDEAYEQRALESGFIDARGDELDLLGSIVQHCLQKNGPACGACPLVFAQDRVEMLAKEATQFRGIPAKDFNRILRVIVDGAGGFQPPSEQY